MIYRRVLPCAFLLMLLMVACGPVLRVEVQQGAATPPSGGAETSGNGVVPGNPGTETEACEYATSAECLTEDVLTTTVTYLTFFAELCGALVIAVATVRALLRYVPHIFGREQEDDPYAEDIRLQLGKSLALALEFELGADILKTAVAPTLSVIAQLAAIAILRTFLNYFLERELRQAEQRRAREERSTLPTDGSAQS